MAHAVATTLPKIYVSTIDVSGHANAHFINRTQELPDDTCYGDANKQRQLGLQHMNFSIAGNIDLAGATDTDTILQSKMGVANTPLMICNNGVTVGMSSPAEFGMVAAGTYEPVSKIGEILKYTLTGQLDSSRWVRGSVLWAPTTSVTGTANGSAVQLGAVASTQYLFAQIHVIAATSLTSVTVKVQSDDNSGFTSATDRITFTAFSDLTAQFATPVAGAITDDYWRIIVSAFSGTSCQFIGAVGIATWP